MICEACGQTHGPVNERIECLSKALRAERGQSRRLRELASKYSSAIRRAALVLEP